MLHLKYFCFVFLLVFATAAQTQENSKYWVFFSDKNNVEFNPHTFFHPKAIERRIQNNFPLDHESDKPVNEFYLQKVAQLVDSSSHHSRWFNAVAVYANLHQIHAVKTLGFVRDVKQIHQSYSQNISSFSSNENTLGEKELFMLRTQLERFNPEVFYENNLDGTGVRVAVFDAGFPKVDVHEAFEHLRNENRIVETFDFVRNKSDVYGANMHGTMVLSNIAGMYKGQKVGLATGATFLLARTEIGLREVLSEEENWLAAIEWADKHGVDVVNSSLGYTVPRYFTEQMDGSTTLVTKAGNLAARKGILIVNSAGNEGNDSWKVMGAPADADSVLAIGGIDPFKQVRISFSSYGPTADKRLKPNVCAYGFAVVAKPGIDTWTTANGTSFASPLLAGFAACAKQRHPNIPVMELFRKIENSGDLYPYFDYAHGYGIPQANKLMENQTSPIKTFKVEKTAKNLKVVIDNINFDPPEFFDDEFLVNHPEQIIYYHYENKEGFLSKYFAILVEKNEPFTIPLKDIEGYKTIRIFYRGYMETIHISDL